MLTWVQRSMSRKRVHVVVGRLGRLAQDQLPRVLAPRGVAALAVGLRLARTPPSGTGSPRRRARRGSAGRAPRRGCRSSRGTRTRSPRRASARACRRSSAPCRCRRARAGTTRAPGRAATRPGCRSSTRIFGSLFWRKSAGRSDAMLRVLLERGERVLAACRRSPSARAAGARRAAERSSRIWRTMMSRKEWPSLTSSSDFAFSIPMLVPRPPLSLITTVRSSASASTSSGSDSASGMSSSCSRSASGSIPDSPATSCS